MIEYTGNKQEAAGGYRIPILNAASEFQSQNTYTVPVTGYGAEADYAQSQGVTYQRPSQETSAPVDVRDSKCPTQGHCSVCHRLCMVKK